MAETIASTVLRALGLRTTIVDLASPLHRDECIRRLRAHVDSRWAFLGDRSVIGRIDETSFTLNKRIVYANSFQTVLRGTLVEESRQTLVHCRLGLHPNVRVLEIIWFAGVGLFACVAIPTAVSSLLHGGSFGWTPPIASAAISLFMLCFGLAMLVIGRVLARKEQQFLLDFVGKLLDARSASRFDG